MVVTRAAILEASEQVDAQVVAQRQPHVARAGAGHANLRAAASVSAGSAVAQVALDVGASAIAKQPWSFSLVCAVVRRRSGEEQGACLRNRWPRSPTIQAEHAPRGLNSGRFCAADSAVLRNRVRTPNARSACPALVFGLALVNFFNCAEVLLLFRLIVLNAVFSLYLRPAQRRASRAGA